MSQSFSLYSELTVRQNLTLHARLFNIAPDVAKARIAELVDKCNLSAYLDDLAAELPLGIRQRLSLAVAIVHKPDLLILDEPTSGVDPLARDQFWELLIDLSRNQGVTIFVSTHFMNEAARCDRLSLMHEGRVLATDTPDGLVKARHAANLEEAFISYLEEAMHVGKSGAAAQSPPALTIAAPAAPAEIARQSRQSYFSFERLFAYTIRESLELLRDPIRLMFALFGTAFLMTVFGFGISTDVNNLSFAALDRDQTPESRAYLEELRGSRYFTEKPRSRTTRTRSASQERGHQDEHRNSAELRRGYQARPACMGQCVDRRRDAVSGGDDPRISSRHASIISDRSGGEDPPFPVQRRRPTSK